MRAIILALAVATPCLAHGTVAMASPAHDTAALMQPEALGDRDRWQGRHHYLYDEQHPAGAETTGSGAASDARACAREPVRLSNPDGTSILRRLKRCD